MEAIKSFLFENYGIAVGYIAGLITIILPSILTDRREKNKNKTNIYKELSRLKTVYHQNLCDLLGLFGQCCSTRWHLKRNPDDKLQEKLLSDMERQAVITQQAAETKALINAEIAESKLLFKFTNEEIEIANHIENWTHIIPYEKVDKYFNDHKGMPPLDNLQNPRDFVKDFFELLDKYLVIISKKL